MHNAFSNLRAFSALIKAVVSWVRQRDFIAISCGFHFLTFPTLALLVSVRLCLMFLVARVLLDQVQTKEGKDPKVPSSKTNAEQVLAFGIVKDDFEHVRHFFEISYILRNVFGSTQLLIDSTCVSDALI